MRIALNISDENPAILEKWISPLINHARINLNKILYNREEKLVEIPLTRKSFDFKVTFWGERPRYHEQEKQAILRIRHVKDIRIHTERDLLDKMEGFFTVLFGLVVKASAIYISSAEENRGKQMCEIIIFVSSLDIEIVDVN